jgi:hypothetical protein
MIRYLDESIGQLLRTKGNLPATHHIGFEIPDEHWKTRVNALNATDFAINVYLYDVRENRKLRSNERRQERVNGLVKEKQVPARVDCMYLITAWKAEPQAPASMQQWDTAREEHQVLSLILHTLLRFPVLPATALQGALAKLTPVPELPASVAQPDGIKNLGDFWSSVRNEWRPAIQYVVTVPFDIYSELETPQVTSKVRHSGQLEDPRALCIRPPLTQDWVLGGGVRRTSISAGVARLEADAKKGGKQIAVVSTAGLGAGDVLLIGSGARTEFGEAGGLPAGGKLVDLAAPLRFDHGAGTLLHGVADGDSIGALVAVASASSAAISVESSVAAQVSAGDVLKLETATQAAYGQVTSVGPAMRGLGAGMETLVQIGGRVQQAGAPGAVVTGAEVRLAELGLVAHSDAQGRFTFANLSPGSYRLRAEAQGFKAVEKSIQVPGGLGDYDITLVL